MPRPVVKAGVVALCARSAAKIILRSHVKDDDKQPSRPAMKYLPRLLLSLAALALPACEAMDKIFDPQPPHRAEDPVAVVPPEFLFTRSTSLNHWLDEAVRVQITDVPLVETFNHPALRGLQYQIVKAPSQNPLVNIDKLAMTRRQLLWVLSHDHQLHMTPNFGRHGHVNYIEIRSRSVDLPKGS